MSLPALHVVLSFEAAPRLVWDVEHDRDAERLADWLAHDPRLLRLLALADEIASERRAA